jgi:hypothetical protein
MDGTVMCWPNGRKGRVKELGSYGVKELGSYGVKELGSYGVKELGS